MRITNFTDYALRILMYLAVHQERLCTGREIADFYEISLNHVVKIVHRLATEGYIETLKGKGGGIKLKNAPKRINLGKLFTILEPELNLVECFDPNLNTCNIVAGCGLKNILKESLDSFVHTLNQYTLEDTITNRKLFTK